MAWIAAVIAAAAAAAQAANAHHAAVKQDKVAASGIRDQSAKRQEAADAVAARLAKLRTSNPEDDAAKSRSQYLDQLNRARTVAVQGLGKNPGYSSAYNDLADKTATSETDYANQLADLTSRIDAPQQQRQREGLDTANLGSSFENVARQSGDAGFLTKLRIGAINPNPWVGLAASAAQGAANGYASRKG